jgi:hypothetical protein
LKYLTQPWYESTLEVNFGKHDKLLELLGGPYTFETRKKVQPFLALSAPYRAL